jgi:hypothetical protein
MRPAIFGTCMAIMAFGQPPDGLRFEAGVGEAIRPG